MISSGDVAVFIVATLLHDCAMHLSEDGFATLLRSDDVIEGFGEKFWKLLWEDFIAESRRFSGRKLMALFGDIENIIRRKQEEDLKPMSIETFYSRIEESEQALQRGEVITQDELREEIKTWEKT